MHASLSTITFRRQSLEVLCGRLAIKLSSSELVSVAEFVRILPAVFGHFSSPFARSLTTSATSLASDFIWFLRYLRARDVRQAKRISRRVAEFVRILLEVFGRSFRAIIRKKSHDFCYKHRQKLTSGLDRTLTLEPLGRDLLISLVHRNRLRTVCAAWDTHFHDGQRRVQTLL